MRVAITGATGYLGAHIARALLMAGHHVQLLVLPDEVTVPVLDRLRALGPVSIVVGDIRRDTDVRAVLEGVDAVVSAAGVVGTDERRVRLMWDVNAFATEALLRLAVEKGLDPVVSVSSYSSLFPPPDGTISLTTPTASGRSAYAKTKGYADRVARELQRTGAPVVVTYPSSVVGPAFFTAPGVTQQGWAPIVRWAVAPTLKGGMQMIDVRDVAEVHARLLHPGRGPRRYLCGGVLLTFDEMVDALEQGLGQRIRRIPLPKGVLLAAARAADVAARLAPLPAGLSYEAATLLTAGTATDDSVTLRELAMTWRSPRAAIVESLGAHAVLQEFGDPPA